MLPYQAVAMDYAVASAGFHHHQRPGGLPGVMGLPGPGPGLNPGLNSAFTHSWFVQTSPDICRQQQASNQSHLEPGILELRKEKSRDAARSRRGKENYEFYELAKMLPLPAAITSQLDKASIIRLTISYLKLRDFSGHGDPPWSRDSPPTSKTLKGAQSRRTAAGLAMELFEQHQGTHILQSLDGFALSVAADGRFLYISETVSIYLGLSQVEMTGSSIFDYVHQADHAEIAEQLGLSLAGRSGALSSPSSEEGSQHGTNNPDVSSQMSLAASGTLYRGMDRAFCVRMKSTLTKRGCHFKSSGYRVVLMLCRLRPQYTFSHSRKAPPQLLGMVALAIALPPPSVHEIRLESDMFVTRINFDFRIAHCEPRVSELLGYTAEELTGKNLYALCHGEDANKLRKCHVDLMNKGQVLTHYYRLMNKLGGYTWMQTCATVVCSSKNADEQNIICVNYVISGREYPNTVMDCCQLEESVQGVKREEITGDPENGPPDADSGAPPPPPRHAAERTEAPNNNDSASTAPPTSDVTHLTRLSDTQPLPLHTTPERTSPMPARRLKKRKHTTDCEEDADKDDDRRKSSSNPGAAMSPIERENINKNMAISEGTDATSVRDLENAMSKHLPALDGKEIAHRPTDFSTDALLKQQQKSTIQWIGTQNHHINHLNRQIPGNHSSTPASALLRQLYANRESVIRSNFLGDGRTGGYYSGDGQSGPLPTPPGSEGSGYGEQLGHKNTDIGSLAYGGYADYHSAMTPPGSVSPRDKQQYALSYDNSAYSEALRHSYLGEAALPLKPQAYSAVPGALDYAPLDQSQFFHPSSSFHLYHPQAHAHAQQPDKSAPPNTNWYSANS
ncbi:protein trachealess isoform X2 [Aricia agestis]|uniref:protein trachealess isoform X2 n=1 Tax=Aricia agestis TaxID=91739 RepID=UPI001C20808D|nr:protein trachealess isoform X2 [Aricia agestis]